MGRGIDIRYSFDEFVCHSQIIALSFLHLLVVLLFPELYILPLSLTLEIEGDWVGVTVYVAHWCLAQGSIISSNGVFFFI